MRSATTIALFLLVAGVGAFIFLKESKTDSTTRIANRSSLLLELDPEEIVALDLKTHRCAIVLTRKEGEEELWLAGGDVEDRLRPDWIKGFLDAVVSIEVLDAMEVGENGNGEIELSQAGFGEKAGRLVVTRRGGKKDVIELGVGGALEGTLYLRRPENREVVLLVRSPLRDFTHGNSEEIRDTRLWVQDPAALLGFVYSGLEGEATFLRESADDYWKIEKPLKTEAADATVQRMLDLLAEIRADGFPEEFPELPSVVSEGEVISFRLLLPRETKTMREEVSADEEEGLTLSFWRTDANGVEEKIKAGDTDEQAETPARTVYAKASDRAAVMTFDPRVWEALNYGINDLRNRTLARLNPEAIAAIRIAVSGAPRVELERRGERWLLHRAGKRVKANGERVDRLIKTITEADILDFVSDSASSLADYGLEDPLLSITLAGSPEAEGETLDFGTNEKAIFAHWRDDPFVYQVSAEVLSEIPAEEVKWKNLTVLQFSIFSLRSLRISPGSSPSIDLNYDYRLASWQGRRAGEDITELIDPARAEMLVAGIGSLIAVDWLADSSVGFAALETPELVVDVSLQPPMESPAAANRGLLDLRLSFAPAGAEGADSPFYYGAVDGVSEVFLVRKELVDLIATPPLKETP